MIKVNSQQCGAGKTTQWIYPIIKNLLLRSQNVLLVVPSIDLQYQYAEKFQNHITVINNKNCKNVTKDIFGKLDNKQQFICITHQAFEQCTFDVATKVMYNLIIDEVINPYRIQRINLNSKWLPDFKFDDVFAFTDKEYFSHDDIDYTKDTSCHQLTVTNPDPDKQAPFINESKKWQDLIHKNYKAYLKYDDHVKLCKQEKGQVTIVQELDSMIICKWADVYIAGAAFENTFMVYWLKQNNLEYEVVEAFEAHDTKIRLHSPNTSEFKWSKHKKNSHKEILNKYHAYVNKHTSSPLVVRNNDELRTLIDEIRVNHNVHGMNLPNRHKITSVSLETALVPDYYLTDFYKNVIGLNKQQIIKAYSAYLFYQIVMRTAIRDGVAIDVFALDVDTICELVGYFNNVEVIDDIDVSYTAKKAGRPKNGLTRKEYMREYMQKYRADTCKTGLL